MVASCFKNQFMVQMAPNRSDVSATVVAMVPYATKSEFYLLQLEITSSKKSTDQLQMPGAEKGTKLKAILSKSIADELKLTIGTKVECELKKVSLDLWRIGTITTKSASKQKKK